MSEKISVKNRIIINLILIFSLFLLCILFQPYYWAHLINKYNFGFIFQAFIEYNVYIAIVIVFVFSINITLSKIINLVNKINNTILNKKKLTIFLIMFSLLSGLFLFTAYQQIKNWENEKNKNVSSTESSDNKIPEEYIYLNNNKIDMFMVQINPDYKTTEITVANSSESSIGTKFGNQENNINGSFTNKGSIEEKQVKIDSIVKNANSMIKYLEEKKLIVSIDTPTSENNELSKFESTIKLITERYRLSINNDDVERKRKEITDNYISNIVPKEIELSTYLKLSGMFNVNLEDQNIVFTYNYLNSNNYKITFSALFSKIDFNSSELNILKANDSWKINVYCKIINKQIQGNSTRYYLDIIAITR